LLSADRVVSFGELTEALWESALPPSTRVAVHVMRLRKALGAPHPGRPGLLLAGVAAGCSS
jgi:DNA-binding response OmpR family regulator